MIDSIIDALNQAVTDRASAVEALRARLAHDWTGLVPAETRSAYEALWAKVFVARVATVADSDWKQGADEDSALIQAFAILYARQNGGYIARDGDLDDDGAGFDILWLTIPTPDGPREIGIHLDDSSGLGDIPSRRGERRVVPDCDEMLRILRAAATR